MPPSPLTQATTEALRQLAGRDADPANLVARFAVTHHTTRQIEARLPEWMEELSDLDRLIALWERREGPTPWLWMDH